MPSLSSVISRVNTAMTHPAHLRMVENEAARLNRQGDQLRHQERAAADVASEGVAAYLFGASADDLRGTTRYRVERGALSYIRSIFTPWRKAADDAAVDALEQFLAHDLGEVSIVFRQLSPPVRAVMARKAFVFARSAHDLVLEGNISVSSGHLALIADAVAAEIDGARR